jgi:hypothetical protein
MSGSFLYRRDAEIMVECAVSYTPRSVHCLSEYLDCCLWMMAVWDLLAQPHSSVPYVQMGLMTDLYIRNLYVAYVKIVLHFC